MPTIRISYQRVCERLLTIEPCRAMTAAQVAAGLNDRTLTGTGEAFGSAKTSSALPETCEPNTNTGRVLHRRAGNHPQTRASML